MSADDRTASTSDSRKRRAESATVVPDGHIEAAEAESDDAYKRLRAERDEALAARKVAEDALANLVAKVTALADRAIRDSEESLSRTFGGQPSMAIVDGRVLRALIPADGGVSRQMSVERQTLVEAIQSATDLWDEPLDEVHDIPQIVNAILSSDWLAEHVRAEIERLRGERDEARAARKVAEDALAEVVERIALAIEADACECDFRNCSRRQVTKSDARIVRAEIERSRQDATEWETQARAVVRERDEARDQEVALPIPLEWQRSSYWVGHLNGTLSGETERLAADLATAVDALKAVRSALLRLTAAIEPASSLPGWTP